MCVCQTNIENSTKLEKSHFKTSAWKAVNNPHPSFSKEVELNSVTRRKQFFSQFIFHLDKHMSKWNCLFSYRVRVFSPCHFSLLMIVRADVASRPCLTLLPHPASLSSSQLNFFSLLALVALSHSCHSLITIAGRYSNIERGFCSTHTHTNTHTQNDSV